MLMKFLLMITFISSITIDNKIQKHDSVVAAEIQDKIRKINTFTPSTGTWTGKYYTKSLPNIKFGKNKIVNKNDFLKNGVEVKIVISTSDIKLYFKYNPLDEWLEVKGDTKLDTNPLGFQLTVLLEEDVWIERYWFSITRTSEFSGKMVSVRTVHNWFDLGKGTPDFFSIYSEGFIIKSKDGAYYYSMCVAEENKVKAIEYCMKSAEFGDFAPLLVLGHLYFEGVSKDLDLASMYYEKFTNSCASGYAYGLSKLGHVAIEKNNSIEAYKWYYLCENTSYSGCDNNLKKTKRLLTKQQIIKAENEASDWLAINPMKNCKE